jgi:hypothetical protein
MANGVCKLTGQAGRFVRSHLIPLALTKPDTKGAPLIQLEGGKRPVRRWSSWYDDHLVIRKGEDLLADLDNWAIKELRKHSLIWSGWGSTSTLPPHHPTQTPTGWGARLVSAIDFVRLRLFLQSLLWRAAATERGEFSEIDLPPEDLEVLRIAVLDGRATPLEFYPATLLQISTRGLAQNMVPLAQMMRVPNLPGLGARHCRIFRFYLDGLVVHFHRQVSGSIDAIRPSVVGAGDTLLVGSVTYERSFQRETLGHFLRESSESNCV